MFRRALARVDRDHFLTSHLRREHEVDIRTSFKSDDSERIAANRWPRTLVPTCPGHGMHDVDEDRARREPR
jgi:hypothetical protein